MSYFLDGDKLIFTDLITADYSLRLKNVCIHREEMRVEISVPLQRSVSVGETRSLSPWCTIMRAIFCRREVLSFTSSFERRSNSSRRVLCSSIAQVVRLRPRTPAAFEIRTLTPWYVGITWNRLLQRFPFGLEEDIIPSLARQCRSTFMMFVFGFPLKKCGNLRQWGLQYSDYHAPMSSWTSIVQYYNSLFEWERAVQLLCGIYFWLGCFCCSFIL